MTSQSRSAATRASVWPAAREELHDILVAACARADHGLIATGTPKTVCDFAQTKQALLLSPDQREVLLADLEGLTDDRRSVVVDDDFDAVPPREREAFNRTTCLSCQGPHRFRPAGLVRRRRRRGRHFVRGTTIICNHSVLRMLILLAEPAGYQRRRCPPAGRQRYQRR